MCVCLILSLKFAEPVYLGCYCWFITYVLKLVTTGNLFWLQLHLLFGKYIEIVLVVSKGCLYCGVVDLSLMDTYRAPIGNYFGSNDEFIFGK